MKSLIFLIASVFFSNVSEYVLSQSYNGSFHELFFGMQPSARSEAMGRSISSIPGDPNSYYFNPASLAVLNGMNINGGGTSPAQFDLFKNASYGFGAASWKFGNTATLGLSVEVFNTGEYNISYISKYGDTVSGKFNNSINNYRLTMCKEITKDFFAGANLNFFVPDYNFGMMPLDKGNLSGPYLYLDMGILKSFNYGPKIFKHTFSFGASIVNVNSAGFKLSEEQGEGKLPVIMRIASSYNLHRGFDFLLNVEYEDVLNSQYYEAIHTGFEFSLEPLLYLRAGYYSQDIPDKKVYSQFTYGIGVNILILGYFTGMEEMPTFKIILDYSHLNLPSYIKEMQDNNKSDLYTITLTKWF